MPLNSGQLELTGSRQQECLLNDGAIDGSFEETTRLFYASSRLWLVLWIPSGLACIFVACVPSLAKQFETFFVKPILPILPHGQHFCPMLLVFVGVGMLINSCIVFYIPYIIASEPCTDMLRTVVGVPHIRSQLHENFATCDVAGRYRALITWIVGSVGFLACVPAPYNYRVVVAWTVQFILFLCPLYMIIETFLNKLLNVCAASVDVVIRRMLPEDHAAASAKKQKHVMMYMPTHGTEVDWLQVCSAYQQLDHRLETLWDIGWGIGEKGATLVLAPLLLWRCVFSLYFLALGMNADVFLIQSVLCFVSFVMLFNSLALLWPVAEVTDKCLAQTSKAGSLFYSVPAVALRFVSDASLSDQQRIDHLRCLQYVQTTQVGIALGGVLITKPMILNSCYRLAASFPLLLTILSRVLRK